MAQLCVKLKQKRRIGMAETDPVNATSPSLSRQAFVGLSAAAAGATTFGIAHGQTLGAPHAPLVPDSDPTITIEEVKLRRPDGEVRAYAATPKNVRYNTPGVVVIMHIWGVDTQIRDVVRRFAKAGYSAIAPDLYSRFGAPSGDGVSDIGTFRPFAGKLDRTQYNGDIRAAALWLSVKSPESKIGVTGFCMGGHIVLIQSVENADIFAGAAPFYGAVKDINPREVAVAICGSYGERDTSIPAEEVHIFDSLLRVPHDIRIYPTAGHAFFDDQRSAYVPSAAQDAWMRTLAFFKVQLGEPTT